LSNQSPTASQFARKTFTPIQIALVELINSAIVRDSSFKRCRFLTDFELPNEGEFTKDGERQKFYSADMHSSTTKRDCAMIWR
jgi:hypothetical protein